MATRRADEITRANNRLTVEIAQRWLAEQELEASRAELEVRVLERTAELGEAVSNLRKSNEQLSEEIATRKVLEKERERLLAETLERADRDALTGLLNHRAYQTKFNEEAEHANRNSSSFAIAIVDVDNFRFFNEVYGHAAADDVLAGVGAAIGKVVRERDTLARYGGDEFALIIPSAGAADVNLLTQLIKNAVAEVLFRPDGATAIPINVSVGAAVYPADGANRLEMLDTAVARLLRSKGGDSAAADYCDQLRAELLGTNEGFRMLDALLASVDNKDRYTRRHSEDVLIHSVAIAREMSVDLDGQKTIAIAALLHDVGKIGVPDAILRKPGALTEAEFEAVKLHPTLGAIIVEAIAGFEPMIDCVRYHHERWDGRGYPVGLIGTETPFFARLMAVADSYSAMTTERPYRKGMRPEIALKTLADGAGTQWDPECVAAMIRTKQADATRDLPLAA